MMKWACEVLKLDPSSRNNAGLGILHCDYIKPEVARYLVQEKKVSLHSYQDKWTPIFCAIPDSESEDSDDDDVLEDDNAELLKCYLELGANVFDKDAKGNTPLHVAVRKKKPNCIKVLLEHGADMFEPNKDGGTPFSDASDALQDLFIQHHRKLLQHFNSTSKQNDQLHNNVSSILKTVLEVQEELKELKEQQIMKSPI